MDNYCFSQSFRYFRPVSLQSRGDEEQLIMWPLLIAVVFPAVESWFFLCDFQISFVQHLLVYETVGIILNFVQKEPSLPGGKVVNVMQRI